MVEWRRIFPFGNSVPTRVFGRYSTYLATATLGVMSLFSPFFLFVLVLGGRPRAHLEQSENIFRRDKGGFQKLLRAEFFIYLGARKM